MNLTYWAMRWNIPQQALSELTMVLQEPTVGGSSSGVKSESFVGSSVQLEATQIGCRMWRNNVGVFEDIRGIPVRYGLCNESSKVNKKTKSSDYIGITPIPITSYHVGMTFGVFTAVETKKQGWKYSPNNEREVAQLNFHNIVAGLGGIACFINDAGQFEGVVQNVRTYTGLSSCV